MLLKKFTEFSKYKILENYLNQKELITNKEELIQKMKDLPESNFEDWGMDGETLSYDMREVFFNMRQDENNKEVVDRASMVHQALENYGILPAFNILLMGYIGQVNNGGHAQYVSNGYASSSNRGDADSDMHDLLLELWKESGFNKFSKSSKLCFEVAEKLELGPAEHDCDYCGGSGEEEEEVEHEYEDGETYTEIEYSTCGQCNGSGTEEDSRELQAYNANELDTKLYNVNTHIVDDFERYLAFKYLD